PLGADHSPGFFGTDAIHLGRGAVDGNVDERIWHRVQRVLAGVAHVVHEGHDVTTVARGEPLAEGIGAEAILPAAVFESHLQRLWFDDEIFAAQIERLRCRLSRRHDFAAVGSAAVVYAI